MKRLLASTVALSLFTHPFSALAFDNWDTVSEVGTYGLVGLAFAKPLYDIKGWTDVKKSWHGISQAAKSIGSTSAIAIVGSEIFDQESTNGNNAKNFISTHTANAFSAATHLHLRYGWEIGFPAYGIAALVGYGRVESQENEWKDVLVGAAIGSVSAWFFTESRDRKVELTPWASTKEVGLNIAYSW